MSINLKKLMILGAVALTGAPQINADNATQPEFDGYLFTYFTGNSKDEEAVRYALSQDGFTFTALNNNEPVISSAEISETGGVRDPHLLRGEDGRFYMVLTDMVSANGWSSNRGLILLSSDDLINWRHSAINIQKRYPGQEDLLRVWAPQTIYDPEAGKYMVYFSMKHGEENPDIIYYVYANDDFTDFIGEPKPLFIPQDKKSCIDGDIVEKDGMYYLFYKTEGHGNGIKVATTNSLTSGEWTEYPDYKQQTTDAVEGAGTYRLNGTDTYILMYDVYMRGRYELCETTDLLNFTPLGDKIKMNFHPRHGSVISLTKDEYNRLLEHYGTND